MNAEKLRVLATKHADHSVDSRGRESWDFDEHGLAQFAATLLATTRPPADAPAVDDAMVRDAARYRWIRWNGGCPLEGWDSADTDEERDAAIDAAITGAAAP